MKYAVLFLILLLGCIARPPEPNVSANITPNITVNDSPASSISSFEECVAAGNPVMESYPRQCRAGNRTFVSLVDFFQVNKNTGCGSDLDCVLTDSSLGFSCCYAGACEPLNYSDAKWEAVSGQWLASQREQYCPADCGPAPGCPFQILNDSFEALCQDGQCRKMEFSMIDYANLTEPEEENVNPGIEGLPMGDYLLVLDDVVLPAYDSTCGAFSVLGQNGTTIDKLLVCEKKSKNWVSPEGHSYRILLVKAAAGYSHSAAWADVRIYG